MIIILNGTSSSGKSTIAQALQQRLGDGWLYFCMDDYLSMLGPKFGGLNPDNPEVCIPNEVCYAKKHSDDTYEIMTGKLCSELYATIPAVLELMASRGFNIIVDTFIATNEEFVPYKAKLEQYSPLFVYLYAPEHIIYAREKARGDRLIGSANHWLKTFECANEFKLKMNTAEINTEQTTEIIVAHLNLDDEVK